MVSSVGPKAARSALRRDPPWVAPSVARDLRRDHWASAGRGARGASAGGGRGHRHAARNGAVALAELYSELLGFEPGERRRASLSELRHLGADIAAVAFGIAFPAVFFFLAAIGVLGNEAAFTAAKWTGLGLIGLYGFAGARLSGAGVPVSVMQAVGVALIGALLIALKALVH
jgi:hypothetical protein